MFIWKGGAYKNYLQTIVASLTRQGLSVYVLRKIAIGLFIADKVNEVKFYENTSVSRGPYNP